MGGSHARHQGAVPRHPETRGPVGVCQFDRRSRFRTRGGGSAGDRIRSSHPAGGLCGDRDSAGDVGRSRCGRRGRPRCGCEGGQCGANPAGGRSGRPGWGVGSDAGEIDRLAGLCHPVQERGKPCDLCRAVSDAGRRHVRRARPGRGDPPGHAGGSEGLGPRALYRAPRPQVQYPPGPADAQLLRLQRCLPAEYPRDVEPGLLAGVPRRDGASPVQRPEPVEPAPVPVDRQSARVSQGRTRRRLADHDEARQQLQPQRLGHGQAGNARPLRGGPENDHRREDPVLAGRHAARPRPGHRGVLVHLEHVCLGRPGQRLRHHHRSGQSDHDRLLPRQRPRDRPDLPPAGGHGHHRRREHAQTHERLLEEECSGRPTAKASATP